MQTTHRFIVITLLSCFLFSADNISARPRGGGRHGDRRSAVHHSHRDGGAPRRAYIGRSRRSWGRSHRRWHSSPSLFLGVGLGAGWAASSYYSPWDCDYSPSCGLWYFRRTHAWYARPYGCWFYWDLMPAYNNRPVLVIESDKKATDLWFAVYGSDNGSLVQREAPRALTKKENKYLFTNRSSGDVIVISRSKKALASKLSAKEQRNSKLYVVQASAIDKQKPVNSRNLSKTRSRINDQTLKQHELSNKPIRLEHADESLEIEKILD